MTKSRIKGVFGQLSGASIIPLSSWPPHRTPDMHALCHLENSDPHRNFRKLSAEVMPEALSDVFHLLSGWL
jgi:hypothetical protein